jgi:glycosyltransferase involved in cell wall biosynthesis
VPVIVSDIPVLRELVEDSGGGLVAEATAEAFADAVSQLVDDAAEAARRGAAGQAYWREQLTPQAVAERHLRVYERVIAQRER